MQTKKLGTVPSSLFGQILEHTPGSIAGGLSAQLVRNRKFSGNLCTVEVPPLSLVSIQINLNMKGIES